MAKFPTLLEKIQMFFFSIYLLICSTVYHWMISLINTKEHSRLLLAIIWMDFVSHVLMGVSETVTWDDTATRVQPPQVVPGGRLWWRTRLGRRRQSQRLGPVWSSGRCQASPPHSGRPSQPDRSPTNISPPLPLLPTLLTPVSFLHIHNYDP